MTKTEIAEILRQPFGLTKKQAQDTVDGVLDTIMLALYRGESVVLHGLGTLKVTTRTARQGRNPRTGESVEIPARRVVKFKPSGNLKDLVNS